MPRFNFTHRLEVRFRDCDLLGHVNNAVYFTYLEQARFAYWREIDPIDLPEQAPPGGPSRRYQFILAHISCDFRAPAEVGNLLDVKIRVSKIGRSSFSFAYEIVEAEGGKLIAEAESVQVMYDYSAGKSIPVSPEIRTKIERVEGENFG